MNAKKPLAINLSDVHLSLGEGAGRVHILKGLSLCVEEGTSVGLIGPSGSGKSSLLMVIGGLERANEGLVEIAGQSFSGLNEDRLATFRGQNIGIVFQSFHLISNMTALENVAVPLELAGNKNAFDLARKELENVGLADRVTHYPTQLSGGEQQRVAIARALAPRPKILIADEPTGNLDTKTGDEISNLMFKVQKERNMTLILVTHDGGLANRCERVVSIGSGVIDNDNLTAEQEAD